MLNCISSYYTQADALQNNGYKNKQYKASCGPTLAAVAKCRQQQFKIRAFTYTMYSHPTVWHKPHHFVRHLGNPKYVITVFSYFLAYPHTSILPRQMQMCTKYLEHTSRFQICFAAFSFDRLLLKGCFTMWNIWC